MTSIIIIAASAGCGYVCGKFLQKQTTAKRDFYADLVRYLSLLKLNVTGRQVELSQFNNEFCATATRIFNAYITKNTLPASLKAAERKDIERFKNGLNCASSVELTKHIEYYENIFSSRSTYIANNNFKLSSMYVKLGFLVGIMAGILLI